VREGDSRTADEHQHPAPEPIDQAQGDERERQVDGAGDHDVEENIAHPVTGAAVDLLGVVEDHVDPAPLLEDRQDHSHGQRSLHSRRQQLSPAHARAGLVAKRGLDFRQCPAAVWLAADPRQNAAGQVAPAVLHQPARAFGNEPRAHKEHHGGNGDSGEHPAPAVLAVPRQANHLGGGPFRDLPGDQPIDHLGGQDAHHDGQLVQRHQAAPPGSRADFRDVSGRHVGRQADGHAAHHAPYHEPQEGRSPTGQNGGGRKQKRGENQQDFAPEPIAQPAREQGAEKAAQQRATVGPTDELPGVELKIFLVEWLGAANHYPVVAEQKSAERGDYRDEPDIAGVEVFRGAGLAGGIHNWIR